MGEGGDGGGGNSYAFSGVHGHSCSFVYVTCASTEEAKRIGRTLVEAGLAACANVLPGMETCYRWEGKIEEAREAVLIVKTAKERVPLVIERVPQLHSYKVPCVAELPVLSGNPGYLRWIIAGSAG